jgi:hypothetical protein
MDYDAIIEEQRIEQQEFDNAMWAHYQSNNRRSCGDMKCVYCGTLADHFREEERAYAASLEA